MKPENINNTDYIYRTEKLVKNIVAGKDESILHINNIFIGRTQQDRLTYFTFHR